MMPSSYLRIAAPLCAALLGACSPFAGYTEAPSGAFPPDASDAVGSKLADAGAGACVPFGVPDRPPSVIATPDAPPNLSFDVATRTVDFGEADTTTLGPTASTRYLEIGYDLDGVCSHDAATFSCKRPSWADAETYDGPGGRDNAVGALLASVAAATYGTLRVGAQVNLTAASGEATSLFRVSGYNGAAIDPKVTVALYAGTAPEEAGGVKRIPRWDGEDVWRAFDTWLVPEADPSSLTSKYQDEHAFVSGGTLVARFERLGIAAGELLQASLVADIRVDDEGRHYFENATIAGRQSVDQVLGALSLSRDPITGESICVDSPNYPMFKRLACAYADISLASDAGPDAPCDGVSWTWKFEAAPARIEPVATQNFNQGTCAEGQAPSDDRCDTLETQP